MTHDEEVMIARALHIIRQYMGSNEHLKSYSRTVADITEVFMEELFADNPHFDRQMFLSIVLRGD